MIWERRKLLILGKTKNDDNEVKKEVGDSNERIYNLEG